MLTLVILFFLFLYFVCELLKYKRVESLRLSIKRRRYEGKLYNERIVFLKAVLLMIDIVLLIIYFISNSSVIEKTSGAKGIVLCFVPFIIFGIISYVDIRRVFHGHNEKIENREEEN